MDKEFVPSEESSAMKEIGFDEPCIGFYKADKTIAWVVGLQNSSKREHITAPLFQQAFKWFREKHNLHSWVAQYSDTEEYCYDIYKEKCINNEFDTHEEAELECLRKLIEIVKNKKV